MAEPATRRRPPDRRPSLTVPMDWSAHRCLVTVGIDPRTGQVVEVFYADGQKVGTELQHTVQDACVIVSLALQHGVPAEALGRSLGCVPAPDGSAGPASPLGAVVRTIAAVAADLGEGGHGD